MIEPRLIEFKTSDELTLPGLLYEAAGSKKAAIYLHGNGSSSVFYGKRKNCDLPQGLVRIGISLLKFNNRGAHIIKKLNVGPEEREDRRRFGCAYEIIKDCVPDIDGAIEYLKSLGYSEFYLMGSSTGANKICVYDRYKKDNPFRKYILLSGGDDTGIYHSIFGQDKFYKLLKESKLKIDSGLGDDIIKSILPDEIFSYKGFYDMANPDGDYNCFPYSEVLNKIKLSKKPLFRYYSSIKKPSLVVYGENDEYAWNNVKAIVEILKSYQPEFTYKIIKGADHGFTGKKKELSKVIVDWINT